MQTSNYMYLLELCPLFLNVRGLANEGNAVPI